MIAARPILPQVAHAARAAALLLGLAQRGQEHAGENRDNGDHNQQFNQRESRVA
jgi:hypothetical protein